MKWTNAKQQALSVVFWLKAALVVCAGGGAGALAQYLTAASADGLEARRAWIAFLTGAAIAFLHWVFPSPLSNPPTLPPPAAR